MTAVCTHCHAVLAPNTLEGLCPRCLLLQAVPLERIEETATTPPAGFTPPTSGELAALFPQLEILELLGQGGMGAVYKARQIKLDRLVALKVLPPAVANDPTFAERFSREARILARLNHPAIVGIHDFGDVNGLFYLIMEFVEGVNLRQSLADGKLEPRQALAIVGELCAAMQYAHEMGVVHRDIKPENILLDRQGRVKVADFGLAKLVGQTRPLARLTATRQAMGTPHYMAPEQWEKPLEVDHRADVYSLGVVFYELLTGELPLGKFAAPSERAGVDVRLDAVVLRAMEKQPEQRFQKMSEMKTAVEAVGYPADKAHEEGPTEPVPVNWALEALITAGMVALVGAVAAFPWIIPLNEQMKTWYSVLFWFLAGAILYAGELPRYATRLSALAFIALSVSYFSWLIVGREAPHNELVFILILWFLYGAAVRVLKSFRPVGPAEEVTAEVPGLTEKENGLRRVIGATKGDFEGILSVLPKIDSTLLATARKKCGVPPEDRILAVFDFSGGEGNSGLLFGCFRLY